MIPFVGVQASTTDNETITLDSEQGRTQGGGGTRVRADSPYDLGPLGERARKILTWYSYLVGFPSVQGEE